MHLLRFGLTKIFDSAPNEVIIPSEIGLPFLLEVHSPAVANLRLKQGSTAVGINTIQVHFDIIINFNEKKGLISVKTDTHLTNFVCYYSLWKIDISGKDWLLGNHLSFH